MSKYKDDVYAHKAFVQGHLRDMALELSIRAANHDLSKFSAEEQEIYERVAPKFQGVKYGTPEYEAVKSELGPALEHHYAHNDHHPEHFEHGISDMNVVQLCEMIADWYAAMQRNSSTDLMPNLEALRIKYDLDPQLFAVVKNTFFWIRNGAYLTPRREKQ